MPPSPPTRKMPRKPSRGGAEQLTLRHSLVLHHWLLWLLDYCDLQSLAATLRDERLEGLDGEDVSRFARELINRAHTGKISEGDLLRYDANIVRHTRRINERRDRPIVWKYFQYLALLFTEIYLDRYFHSREQLLSELNTYLSQVFIYRRDAWRGLPAFTAADLHKVALWNATGSGKTLLMHVNILQYEHYARQAGQEWTHILLVTPNEALSRQHLTELSASGLDACPFQKSGGNIFAGRAVETIEITKLADTAGDKTVAVESLETRNLVLVDEGHRGSSGDVWKRMRDKLSANGFSFEYSATFGQSVGKNASLVAEYGKATLMDYSYKWFYADGYGKDYRILNLNDSWLDNSLRIYLTASLMHFYEQQLVYATGGDRLRAFQVEKPLAIFVGSSVTAVRKEDKREMSDVVTILHFFSQFVGDREASVGHIDRLLRGTDGLIDKDKTPIFEHSFSYLRQQGAPASAIYDGMLERVFGCPVAGATLHLDNMRGAEGEIGLRMGNGDYFGVINVGDSSSLLKLCAAAGIRTADRDFAGQSLFTAINDPQSTINVLIGSKKFTEGWSSWRVSTMGLMNIGRSEGSEIIQLFGRGVRLKGYRMSLKRSSALSGIDDKKPPSIELLETLNIFGIRADYMQQFQAFLEEEGLPTTASRYETVTVPILPVVNLSDKKLKILRVPPGLQFVRDVKEVKIVANSEARYPLATNAVTLDCYSKLQMLRSPRDTPDGAPAQQHEAKLTDAMLSWVDWQRVWLDAQALKRERGWSNLSIDREQLPRIMADNAWYRLYISDQGLAPADFHHSRQLWQTLTMQLLGLYIERTYNKHRSAWMARHMETTYLDCDDPNFAAEYQIMVRKDLDYILANLGKLKAQLEDKSFAADLHISREFVALHSSPHLYEPLLYLGAGADQDSAGQLMVEVRPVPLNEGERDLVNDIRRYYNSHADRFADRQLYLLRNQSRRGVGFFEANNFYPDFILWLVEGRHQYISFIDPKGISHLRGLDDPKIRLAQSIRESVEPQLHDPDITLSSFIVSNTPLDQVLWWLSGDDRSDDRAALREFNAHHVLFQREQREEYVELLLRLSKEGGPDPDGSCGPSAVQR